MDTIKEWLPSVLPFLGNLVGGMMSGPLGAIMGAISIVGILIGGVVLYNKYKQFLFNKAQDQANTNAVGDSQSVIANNQNQAPVDQAAIAQSQADKLKAKEGT